ncbi:MAG: N-acyl-D-amino-acid deacylase family protein [Candidatus Binataceae bacterium]
MSRRWDAVIRNATVYDGTGVSPVIADVAIDKDRIGAVGQITESGGIEIEAKGLALAPGFIDVHSHDDAAVFIAPEMDFKVMQGVTTEVVGNCGMGAAPYGAGAAVFGEMHGRARLPEWEGYRGYLEAVDRDPPSLNVATLAGHGTMRTAAMGNARRPPANEEKAAMCRWLSEAIEAGAVGLSTGLIYEPGRYAETAEIVELARVMTGSGALYASHMRNEAAGLLDSVRETIRIGTEAGVAVQISHHKASGRDNWGKVRESLGLIEDARAQGFDVTADQYPYTSGSTVLVALLHNNVFNERGREGGVGTVGPEHVLIASAPRHLDYEGKTLKQLADRFRLGPEAAARRIVDEEGNSAVAVIETMDEADVRFVMSHPTTMIGSDGIFAGGNPHPRLYGTFPRVLGRYARELGLMSMAEAVRRMTAMPAQKFGLRGRGTICPGAYADLVVFDPASIIDTATYDQPRRHPDGIKYVFVNGSMVVRDEQHTHARPGRALRRGE